MITQPQTLVEQIGLPKKLIHILHRNDVRTLGELQEIVNRGDLLQLRFVGKKLADEIGQLIAKISTETNLIPREIAVQGSTAEKNTNRSEKLKPAGVLDVKAKLGHVPIQKLELPREITSALVRASVTTISDLLSLSTSQLTHIKRIGPKSIREIQISLDKFLSSPESFIEKSFFEEPDTPSLEEPLQVTEFKERHQVTWAEIIEPYFRSEKEVRTFILLSRFGFVKKTLEELASELNITRERVRQIQVHTVSRFGRRTSFSDASRLLNRVNNILSENEENLSLELFRAILNDKNLLGEFSKPINSSLYILDPFEVLICWLDILSDSRITVPAVAFPIEIDDLRKATNISIRNYRTLQNIPKISKKKLLRKVTFTGGIHMRDAIKILATTKEIARLELNRLSLREIREQWFVPTAIIGHKNRLPLVSAGNKILSVIDQIEFSSFYDGLRRFSGRFYDSIAPEDIILYYVKLAGFAVNNSIVSTQARVEGSLSATETCFFNTVRTNRNVASFIEIAEDFRLAGFSIAAVSAVLARSPIVDKVETGLYKIRGCNVTWEEIENAKKRQRIFTKDAKVSYGLDGVIRYRITLNSWAVYTGVISTNTIKDLAGEWKIHRENGKDKIVTMDDLFIFGLTDVMGELQSNIGDRIELSFNTWNRTLSIRKVEHGES